MKFGGKNPETVVNQCAEFQNVSPFSSATRRKRTWVIITIFIYYNINNTLYNVMIMQLRYLALNKKNTRLKDTHK